MMKIELLIQEFESLDVEEQIEVVGGFVSTALEEQKNQPDKENETNYFQCSCNNYCPSKGAINI